MRGHSATPHGHAAHVLIILLGDCKADVWVIYYVCLDLVCRATFDIDNIDIGPERRAYLETKLERVWEINSEGSIPWVSCTGMCVGCQNTA